MGRLPDGIISVSPFYWSIHSSLISIFDAQISVPTSALSSLGDFTRLRWLWRNTNSEPYNDLGGVLLQDSLYSGVIFSELGDFCIGIKDTTIPVQFISLSGFPNGNIVSLDWVTSTELNNKGFVVERKCDDNPNWEEVGFVEGAGTSSVRNEYSFVDVNPFGEQIYYRLKQIDFDGSLSFSNTIHIDMTSAVIYALSQNFPNPFNPTTEISFSIPKTSHTKLIVYDILGGMVKILIQEVLDKGRYSYSFHSGSLSSGVYFYVLSSDDFREVKQMMILR